MSWEERVGQAPSCPGVYIMRGAAEKVLYVGKAKSLRRRVRSYLDPRRQGARTALLLRQVVDVEFLVTDTELEALILENSLIKKWRPKYNISLRDDKTYPFLRLSVQEEFPTLTVVRRPVPDGARYFGPYVPAVAMRRVLHMIRKMFPLRRCRLSLDGRRRPCLNYQMGRCLAPCAGKVDPLEYGLIVRGVNLFLQGRGTELAAELWSKMSELAAEEKFEAAAVLRDRLAAVESTFARQKVHVAGRGDMDIVGLAGSGGKWAAAVLHGSHGRISGIRTYLLPEGMGEAVAEERLGDFLRAFYEVAARIPPEILLPASPVGEDALAAWLGEKRGRKVVLRVPRTGSWRALVAMAGKNAWRALVKEGADRSPGGEILAELEKLSGRKGPLSSIAAVDVSTLSGSDSVAAMVWWEKGRFVKKHYRRFRVRAADSSDDYAMMGEVVGRIARRVGTGEWDRPDVLMLDGGRGQLSAAQRALSGEGWKPAVTVSIAKPREGRRLDAVFLERRKNALSLARESPLLKLLQKVRDEAHRHALAYHRRLREKRGRRSALDGVPGVGPARRRLLLRHFGSVVKMREASIGELSSVPGLPGAVAAALFDYLRR
jgi:excinuclease ABC subunit C